MQAYNYVCASNINSHIPITPDIYIEVEYTDRKSIFFFFPPSKVTLGLQLNYRSKGHTIYWPENNTFHSNPYKPATCSSHPRQLIPQERRLIKSFQANPLLCFC